MYMTAQRKLLFEFFSTHPDISITARELYTKLNKNGKTKISISAVYRNLSILAKAGLILQVISNDNKEALYRYSPAETCEHRLHMTCLNCGKTYHISQKISEKLTEDVLNTDAFSIDEAQTTIYGRCKTCK